MLAQLQNIPTTLPTNSSQPPPKTLAPPPRNSSSQEDLKPKLSNNDKLTSKEMKWCINNNLYLYYVSEVTRLVTVINSNHFYPLVSQKPRKLR